VPLCLNCERLHLECSGYGSGSGAALRAERPDSTGQGSGPLMITEAGTKRRRTYRSCKACRACKTRCSGERPVCVRCAQKSLDCTYSSGPSPAWVHAISPQSSSGREPDGPVNTGLHSHGSASQERPRILSPLPEVPNYHHQSEEIFNPPQINKTDNALIVRLPADVPHSLSWYGKISRPRYLLDNC
jgi:hypothetical protein